MLISSFVLLLKHSAQLCNNLYPVLLALHWWLWTVADVHIVGQLFINLLSGFLIFIETGLLTSCGWKSLDRSLCLWLVMVTWKIDRSTCFLLIQQRARSTVTMESPFHDSLYLLVFCNPQWFEETTKMLYLNVRPACQQFCQILENQ